ncbi:uncharacterized protein LOC18780408 isoform X2 [Prunus persica]|uniref:uncharacterized protein LOC18780408 isoform X2 n=1 Tax=Prunus persica TaxID=3760 RepID=UPI0009AB2F4E|nr:uncharacterized protein LOC18780408 isoform X2 [Prunus persica]
MNFTNFQKYPNLFSRSLFLLPSHHVASSHNLFTEPTPLLLFNSAYSSFFLLDQLKRIAEPQDSGKFYLVDAGYPQMRGYLGPYKGERYHHLPDFRRGVQPMGHKEVFNHTHSSLRSVIERTFGVWKKRWSILRDMPSYPFAKQVKIVIATMTLHNYIRRHAKRDCHFDESEDDLNGTQDEEIEREVDAQQEDGPVTQEMEALRNHITASLMSSSG